VYVLPVTCHLMVKYAKDFMTDAKNVRAICLSACGRTFSQYVNAKRHLELVHGSGAVGDQRVVCHICLGTYKSWMSLKNHLRLQHKIYQRDVQQHNRAMH
jgi:hypothetical protein